MIMRKHGISLLIVVALQACAPTAQPEFRLMPVPAGWTEVEFDYFAFWLPPGVEETGMEGIDSLVLQYRGEDIEINLDYGLYSSDLREFEFDADGSIEWVRVEGQRARVLSASVEGQFVDAIHYPDAGPGDARLTMVIFSSSTEARVQAEAILRSLRFVNAAA